MRKIAFPRRDEYIEYLLIECSVSMLTVKSYCFDLELFFGYLERVTGDAGLKLDQIDPSDIVGFLNAMTEKRGNVASTRNRKLAALRSYFSFLKINGLLNGQPNPIKRFQGSGCLAPAWL